MVICAYCGASPASAAETGSEDADPGSESVADDPPITWTSAVENGRHRWFCDACSRKHLRAMESKLDSEWW